MPQPLSRPSCRSCAARGCGYATLVVIVAFVIGYALTGRYHPNIASPPARPRLNGYDDFVAAGKILEANGGLDAIFGSRPGGKPVLAQERIVVAHNATALARMQVGLTRECLAPVCRGFNKLEPDLDYVRNLARLTAAQADVRAADGDLAGAAQSCLDAIQIGISVPRTGGTLKGFVGAACETIGQKKFADLVDRLPAAAAERAADRLRSILGRRTAPADLLREEARSTLQGIVDVDDLNGGLLEAFLQMCSYPPPPPQPAAARIAPYNIVGRVAWHFVRDKTLRSMEAHLSAIVREAGKPAWLRHEPQLPTWPLAHAVAPVYTWALQKWEITDARSRILLATLAVRAYMGRRARLPSSLSEAGVPPELTVDPFSGKPLIYKPAGRDYLIYSVGPDLKDDGGMPADESSGSTMTGDIGAVSFARPGSVPMGEPGTRQRNYRRVPHMLPPKLPAGAPALRR